MRLVFVAPSTLEAISPAADPGEDDEAGVQEESVTTELVGEPERYTPLLARLDARDQEIVRLAARGSTQRQIARELGISQPAICQRLRGLPERLRRARERADVDRAAVERLLQPADVTAFYRLLERRSVQSVRAMRVRLRLLEANRHDLYELVTPPQRRAHHATHAR